MVKVVKGNLIDLAKKGNFDIILHGCNCFCVMGAGIAPIMAREFGCDKYELEKAGYKGDINKLGQIEGHIFVTKDQEVNNSFLVVNAYTQFAPGLPDPSTGIPLNYTALALCLQKIGYTPPVGNRIGMPWIGCGLAGGDKGTVKEMVDRYLADFDVTIVEL